MNDDRLRRTVDVVRPHLGGGVGLLALVAILYGPTVHFDFVNWDDPWYVVNNPLIKSWHPSNLFGIATEVVVRNYAPLTIFSFLVDHTLWGLWPGGYHLTNVLLHGVNALLVYALILQLTGSRFTAWVTAALFAVQPVQIETVAWVSSRKGLLSGTFILASLICWLRPQRTTRDEGWGLLWLVLALLCKALAVVVPAIVLLYDMLLRRQPISVAWPRQVIPGFLALMLLFVTMSAQTTQMGGVRDHFDLTRAEILAVDTVILWRYLGMMVYPNDLCVLYDPPTSGIGGWVALATLGWLAVGTAVFFARRRWPMIPFAVCTFGILLLPVLNLFPITTLMNDRYLYLPCISIYGLVAAGINGARGPKVHPSSLIVKGRRLIVYSSVASVLVLYGQMTREHLPVWRSGISLWTHAAAHVPQLAVVQIQLADSLKAEGRTDEALAVLTHTLNHCGPDALDRRRILKKLSKWQN